MTEECDVFNDSLDNEDYRGIFLNCFKNLERERSSADKEFSRPEQTDTD